MLMTVDSVCCMARPARPVVEPEATVVRWLFWPMHTGLPDFVESKASASNFKRRLKAQWLRGPLNV